MYSSICIEVDEFKFYRIIKNVLAKTGEKITQDEEDDGSLSLESDLDTDIDASSEITKQSVV